MEMGTNGKITALHLAITMSISQTKVMVVSVLHNLVKPQSVTTVLMITLLTILHYSDITDETSHHCQYKQTTEQIVLTVIHDTY